MASDIKAARVSSVSYTSARRAIADIAVPRMFGIDAKGIKDGI